MKKYLPNQKLWRIIKTPEGYYYEIRLAGVTIDRCPIYSPALDYLKREGVIKDEEKYANI